MFLFIFFQHNYLYESPPHLCDGGRVRGARVAQVLRDHQAGRLARQQLYVHRRRPRLGGVPSPPAAPAAAPAVAAGAAPALARAAVQLRRLAVVLVAVAVAVAVVGGRQPRRQSR